MKIVFKFLLLSSILLTVSCNNENYSPKPRSFHRIMFPEKEYQVSLDGCPFLFESPSYSQLIEDKNKGAKQCWKNLNFPQFNATLHLSYYDINNIKTIDQLTEDARTFAFKHTSKATAIDQKKISNFETKVYGLEYYIQGNTASNYQFYVTDSTKHYLRGALYFNEKPNLDSIQPVLEFLKRDIEHLISTIRWK